MNLGPVPPLPPGCPWADWAPPTIKWCENNLCGWITTPANTWSNVAYLLVGAWLWREARRLDRAHLAWFGPATVALGACSFAFHASYTFFFQFFDYLGMFLIIFLMVVLNLRRAARVTPRGAMVCYGAGVAVSCVCVFLLRALGVPVQLIIVVLALVVIGQELDPRVRARGPIAYLYFQVSVALVAVATLFTVLDLRRALFDPDNHWIQGHALWHVFTALGLWAAFLFHAQFDLGERPAGGEGASQADRGGRGASGE